MIVAPVAALMLVTSAARTPSFVAAFCHHSSVNDVGGQENTFEELKELTTTTTSGK
jgi:hypothetical protein